MKKTHLFMIPFVFVAGSALSGNELNISSWHNCLRAIGLAVKPPLPLLAPAVDATLSAIQGRAPLATDVFQQSAPYKKYILDQWYVDLTQRFMPSIKDRANGHMSRTKGLVAKSRFYEIIDTSVRNSPLVASALMEVALRRLPFLKETPFIAVLSGGTADPWEQGLLAVAKKLELDVRVVKIPGQLSPPHRPDFQTIPELPEQLVKEVREQPVLYFDDSFVNGGTAEAVREAFGKVGGQMIGTFAAYDASASNPASLIKSANTEGRTPSFGQFPLAPRRWELVPGRAPVLGVELWRTLLDQGTRELNPQARRLLSEAGKMGLTIVTELRGKPAGFPKSESASFEDFREQVKFASRARAPMFSIGARPRNKSQSADASWVPVIPIGSESNKGDVNGQTVVNTYYLDSLVEADYLRPVFYENQLPKNRVKSPGSRLTLDVRPEPGNSNTVREPINKT